jgi:sodium/bile acid cotransporter 7
MGKMLRFFDPYIALMLATVALAAVLPAKGDGAEIAGIAADAGIIFLFFLYGARLSPASALSGLMEWRLHIAVFASTFVLFPLLGLALAALAPPSFPPLLVTGLVFLCVLPSTVQSSIAFTSIARGNVAAAICAATASNILGVFLSPALAGWLLPTSGVALSFDVFRDITLQLLAPFLAGQLMRPLIASFIERNKRWLGYVDRGSILLIIYTAFSKGIVDHIWSHVSISDLLVLVLALCTLLAIALVMTGLVGRKLMALSVENEIVLQFCGSKKSLASGLPMASVLFTGPAISLVVLPLMVFHQIQLIVCAILARRYNLRASDPTSADV